MCITQAGVQQLRNKIIYVLCFNITEGVHVCHGDKVLPVQPQQQAEHQQHQCDHSHKQKTMGCHQLQLLHSHLPLE